MQKRSMNSNGHEIMVALVILATRGPLRRSEGRAQAVLYRKDEKTLIDGVVQ